MPPAAEPPRDDGARDGPAAIAPARDDRVLPAARALAAGILPFLVIAACILLLFPERTAELFAWGITPPLSAALLACAYLGGVWFFVGVVVVREWHRVQHGFPAVVVFASALLVATLLHLDRFSANVPFWTWLALYATTPILVAVVWLLERRRESRAMGARDVVIPRAAAYALAAVGGAAIILGAVLFVSPAFAATFWAWELTPLTSRVTGAVLSLTGVVNAALLRDRRWSAFRILFQAQLVSLAAIATSLWIRSDDLLPGRPMTGAFIALVAGALVSYGALYLWAERARRHARSAAAVR